MDTPYTITIYSNNAERLAHYDDWARKHGFVTPAGKLNRSAFIRYALDKVTGYKQPTK